MASIPQQNEDYIAALVKNFFHSGLKAKLEQNRDRVDVQRLADEILAIVCLTNRAWEANAVDIMIRVFNNPTGLIDLTANFKRETSFDPYPFHASWPTNDLQRNRLEACLSRIAELVGQADE